MGTSNIVRYPSSTFDEILEDLLNYAESQDDESLQNLTLSSTGAIYLELLSGLATFLHHDVMSARLENSISTARLDSSILNMAHLLGYPVRRKSAPKVKLRILNNTGTEINVPRGVPIGTFKEFDVCPLDDYILTAGNNDIYCVIGNWRTHTFQPRRVGDFVRYYLGNTDIENDITFETPDGENVFPLLELTYKVGESSTEQDIELVEYAESMGTNSCLIKTHIDGIVLVFGDGITGKRVSLSDTYTFRYVTTDGVVPYTTISDLESSFSIRVGELVTSTLLYPGANADSIEKVRTLLSGYNYARRRMITLDDHISLLMSYPGVIDANATRIDEDDGCCAVELTPLFEGGTRLDEQSNDPIEGSAGTQVFDLDYDNIFTQTFEYESNSIKLPKNDFTDGLATGSKVWVRLTASSGYTVPGGIQSGRYYYIIRGIEVDEEYVHLKFATTQGNALLGRNISIYPPDEDIEVKFDLMISHYSDKITTVNDISNYEYFKGDLGSTSASSFNVPSEHTTAFSSMNIGDPVIASYDTDAHPFTSVLDDAIYYAIPSSSAPNRIQLSSTPENALTADRVKINTPAQGLDGSVYFNVFYDSSSFDIEDVTISTLLNYIEFSDEDDFPFFSNLISNRQENETNKMRLWLYPGGGSSPFISGVTNNRDYYAYIDEILSGDDVVSYRVYLYDDEFRTEQVNLTSTVVNGKFFIGGYNMEDEVGFLIDVALSTDTFTPESAYSLSNSFNLSTQSSYVLESGLGSPDIRSGDVIRIHDGSESGVGAGTVTLPTGLELGSFYYVIALGNGYFRFGDISSDFDENSFITLSDLESISGKVYIDFFEDFYNFEDDEAVTGNFVFYRSSSEYYNCLNVGDTILTGNDDKEGGYETGTKIKITPSAQSITLPFDTSIYYYIIRVFGTTYVKLAETKSAALAGNGITFTGSYTGGEVTITVYNVPEETQLRDYLEEFRVAGQKILFSDPEEYLLSSDMTVVMDPTYTVRSIKSQIREIFSAYEYKMGETLHIGDIHKEIVNIDGVYRCYIEEPEDDIELGVNQYFKIDPELLSSISILSGEDAIYQSS